jgi:hypothetical protein
MDNETRTITYPAQWPEPLYTFGDLVYVRGDVYRGNILGLCLEVDPTLGTLCWRYQTSQDEEWHAQSEISTKPWPLCLE